MHWLIFQRVKTRINKWAQIELPSVTHQEEPEIFIFMFYMEYIVKVKPKSLVDCIRVNGTLA